MNAPDLLRNVDATLPILRYEILDTPPEPAFDDLARRAAEALGTTMAAISFFEHAPSADDAVVPHAPHVPHITREWFKARTGLTFAALAREHIFFLPAFTATPQRPTVFVIPDTLADKRFREHPLVASAPYICFYAACGLFSPTGQLLGVLSVFDTVSREVAAHELEALKNLAALAQARLEARREARSERRMPPAIAVNDAPAVLHDVQLKREFEQLEQHLEDEIAIRKTAEAKLSYEQAF